MSNALYFFVLHCALVLHDSVKRAYLYLVPCCFGEVARE